MPDRVFGIVNVGVPRGARNTSPPMLLAGNTGRGVSATVALLLAVILSASAGPGAAADGPPGTTADMAAPLPDPGDLVAAYATLRGWINAFDLPDPKEPAARVAIAGASGACVILRRSGRIVGSGVDGTGDDLMLRRAAGRALGKVLGDPAVANLPTSMTADIGRALTLELEVAGKPVPLLGRTFKEVADQLEPGLDGVAIRRGQAWAMLFPAQIRAANTAARVERLLAPLAVDLGLTPMPLPQLAKLHDISIYRLRATHLAQASPDQPPFETFRGDTVVSEAQVTRQSIAALADGIAGHLLASLSPLREPLGVMGTYRPAADRYDPLIAPPLEQALVALALARYGKAPGADRDMARHASTTSRLLLGQLQQVAPGEDDPLASSAACAAIVYAALERAEIREDPDCRQLIAAATERVLSTYTHERGFVVLHEETGETRPIPAHEQALLASAMSRILRARAAQVDAALARSAIDAAWESVPEHQQVTLLPWLGWAESDYAEATGRPVANAERLRRIRTTLDASRIGSASRPGPPDLAGGFALVAGDRLLATAQSLRPAAYLASMLRNTRLTPPQEAQLALGRHLKTMRFLMQLAVRESSAWALRNPSRALGGVRAASWDHDQPVAAQALGLIVTAETLISLGTPAGTPRNP